MRVEMYAHQGCNNLINTIILVKQKSQYCEIVNVKQQSY